MTIGCRTVRIDESDLLYMVKPEIQQTLFFKLVEVSIDESGSKKRYELLSFEPKKGTLTEYEN